MCTTRLHKPENLQNMDVTGMPVDENEIYSDDEYTELVIQSQDYRQTMKLTLPVGELDVAQNEQEERTGR